MKMWQAVCVSLLLQPLGLQGKRSPAMPRLDELLRELGAPATSDRAADELLRLGRTDPSARRLLAERLPTMVEKGPSAEGTWVNAVRVAGGLRLAEASYALAKWIDAEAGGTITFSQELRLEDKPAAKALAEIGDPAVPAVERALSGGNVNARWAAAYVLRSIGSPAAKKALQGHLPREGNLHIRDFIRDALEKWSERHLPPSGSARDTNPAEPVAAGLKGV